MVSSFLSTRSSYASISCVWTGFGSALHDYVSSCIKICSENPLTMSFFGGGGARVRYLRRSITREVPVGIDVAIDIVDLRLLFQGGDSRLKLSVLSSQGVAFDLDTLEV